MLNYIEIDVKDEIIPRKWYPIQINILSKLIKYKYIKFRRINIFISKNTENDIETYKNTCNIHYCLDINFLIDMQENIFLEYSYKLIFQILNELWINQKWNQNDLNDSLSEIIKSNYICKVTLFKKKANPTKSFIGEVCAVLDRLCASIVFYVYDKKKNLVNSYLIIEAHPELFLISMFMNSYCWRNDTEYVIKDQLNEIFIICDINKNSSFVEFHPKDNMVEELNAYLRILDYKTPVEEVNKFFGIIK